MSDGAKDRVDGKTTTGSGRSWGDPVRDGFFEVVVSRDGRGEPCAVPDHDPVALRSVRLPWSMLPRIHHDEVGRGLPP